MWPPSSPDLNPTDYYVWGVFEEETNKCSDDTKEPLKEVIVHVTGNMQEAPLICACSRFRSHMGATVEAEEGFIESTETRGLVEYLWIVSFQCVNTIVQNGDFCSISPLKYLKKIVLKYLPHPVHTYIKQYAQLERRRNMTFITCDGSRMICVRKQILGTN